MAEVNFYHLSVTPLDRALPKLLEKAVQGRLRVIIRTADETQSEALSSLLWTYDPDSFLAHGTRADGQGERQPVYLTHGDEAPNAPALSIVVNGRAEPSPGIGKVLDLFDAGDAQQAQEAARRAEAYRAAGHNVQHIVQTETGGWRKQAA